MTIKNIPVGYKDSPLGIIPVEWEVKRLGEVLSIGNGKDYKHLSVGHVPVFGTGGIITYVNNYLYNGDTVCIGRKGTIDKPIFYSGKIWTVDTLFYTYAFKTTFARYIYLLFQIIDWKKYNEATGVPSLSKSTIERIMIPLPPLAEQEKIAEILSTWDKAIEKQIQLIQKLELRKKGLMQQLLTGKKRLPGFTDEWKKVKAGLIFKSVSIRSNKQEILLSATQEHGVIPRDMLESRVTMPTGDLSSFKLVDVGDFVISLRSFEGGIEYSQYRGVVSPAYTVLKKALDVDSAFYKAYFKSNDFIQRLSVAVIGIRDGKQISYSDFAYIKIPFPALQEQTAIANILSSSDEEIRLAQDKLAAMKEQKKGLMQVLLTGKRRVKL